MKFFGSNIQEENACLNPKAEKGKGFLNSITNVFSKEEARPVEKTCKDKVIDFFEVEKSYTHFFIVLGFGMAILGLSIFFIPMAVFNPQKFVSLFSLGSLITLSSFIFIYGTKEYLNMLFHSQRALLTVLYLSSIIVGIYFSFVNTWMIISNICAIVQFVTLLTFVLSFIPGGNMGINFIWSTIKSFFVRSS